MFGWFKKKSTTEAIARDFSQRLQLARLHQRTERKPCAIQIQSPAATIILPTTTYSDLIIHYDPEPPRRFTSGTLAASLEKILQGSKVPHDMFQELYRSGYVFKEKEKQWSITTAGKLLIERNKLISNTEIRVNGVICRKNWMQNQ